MSVEERGIGDDSAGHRGANKIKNQLVKRKEKTTKPLSWLSAHPGSHAHQSVLVILWAAAYRDDANAEHH